MANQSVKGSELPIASNVAGTDRILVLYNAANGAPSLRTANITTLGANLVLLQGSPASSSANGKPGTVCYDNTHFYVCIANNQWVRATLTTW